MINIKNKSECCGCSACYNICPKNAIKMQDDEKGFKYPKIDKKQCVDCKLCEKVCPIRNKKNILNKPKSYACYNKDEMIRLNSSSGGIFTLIAEKILENKGVVYGAAFNEKWEVEHIRIDNMGQLYKLRTSKYLQSNINNIYKLAKKDLEDDILVLFTGTPCQVNGFFSYLNGKQYDNLYTQDIICHGVPSPKVWKKYLEFRHEKDGKNPLRINFRQKNKGWNSFGLLLEYKNNSYKKDHDSDLFMQAFLRNAILRDSCYNCNFKEKNRQTDLTLADFWGINKIESKFDDNKGTSLVVVNTEKGEKIFEGLKDKMIWKETNFEESIKYNKSMYKSVTQPEYRNEFFENLENYQFDKLVDKFTIKPKKNIIKKILKKVFNSIMNNIKNIIER